MKSIGPHVLLKVCALRSHVGRGAMWSYGLTMRHLGFLWASAVAIGVNAHGGHADASAAARPGRDFIYDKSGLFTWRGGGSLIGVAVVSMPAIRKSCKLRGELRDSIWKLGLLLAVLCGIFSSGMSFAIDAAKPMESAALHLG